MKSTGMNWLGALAFACFVPVSGAAAQWRDPALNGWSPDRAIGCILRANREAGERLAGSAPGSTAEASALRELDPHIRGCLSRYNAADSATVRAVIPGQLAERLYLASVVAFSWGPGAPTALRWSAPSTAIPAGKVPGPRESLGAPAEESGTPSSVARCTVARAPADVDRLVRTEPASDGESRVFATLAPVFTACLNVGQEISTGRTLLRGQLARALYRYRNGPGSHP